MARNKGRRPGGTPKEPSAGRTPPATNGAAPIDNPEAKGSPGEGPPGQKPEGAAREARPAPERASEEAGRSETSGGASRPEAAGPATPPAPASSAPGAPAATTSGTPERKPASPQEPSRSSGPAAGAGSQRPGEDKSASAAGASSQPPSEQKPGDSKPGGSGAAGPQRPRDDRPAQGGPGRGGPGVPPSGGGAGRPGTPPAAARGGGGGWVGGLIGGIIGGILAWVVLTYAVGPDVDRNQLNALQAQVDQLSEEVAATQSDTAGAQDLAARVEALEEASDGDLGARVQALEQAAAETESLVARMEALESAGAAAGEQGGAVPSATVADLTTRLDRLEEQVATAAELPEQLSQLESRIVQAEEAVSQADAGGGSGGDLAALDERLSQLAQTVDQVSSRVPDVSSNLSEAVEELSNEIATTTEQTTALDDRISATRERVQSLAARMEEVSARLQQAEDQRGRAAALALAVGQVSSAIDQGRSYEQALQTLQSLAEGDGVVSEAAAQLEPMAQQGVPTLVALRQDFDTVADDIVHEARAPGDDSLLGRAAGNLMRLVTVRPVGGEAEGESAAARVARAEAKLDAGDLEGATAELEGLQGAAAEAAQPWLERARARIAAQAALSELSGHATNLLAQPS